MPDILIVDDDTQIRKLLRITLEKEGYHIDEASNGNQALKRFHENPPDLVIMDLIMPEKEGIETISEIQKQYPETKIIAISGGGRLNPKNYLDLAEKMGAHKTLAKPFTKNQVIEAVKSSLG
jgi:DNA-binding NtrC family response regulator